MQYGPVSALLEVLAGMNFFNEPRSLRLALLIMCIIAGAAGIKMTFGH
ncbi:hypothetical protein ACSU64_28175 [Bacillaceae bacterium C204]